MKVFLMKPQNFPSFCIFFQLSKPEKVSKAEKKKKGTETSTFKK